MKPKPAADITPQRPQLIEKAETLDVYLKTLSPQQIAKCMHVSDTLAQKTHELIQAWNTEPASQSLAIDSFVGDIYSGLRASELSGSDRDYANKTLCILSGLYGVIKPYDGIMPYRLEMGYRLPDKQLSNLYNFWGDQIAQTIPKDEVIINTSSVEYSAVITNYVDPSRIITPKFLTIDAKTKEPAFVVVHAKIARGAYARWMIVNRIENREDLSGFDDIGYKYEPSLSSPDSPAFVCRTFEGKGLSMRLA